MRMNGLKKSLVATFAIVGAITLAQAQTSPPSTTAAPQAKKTAMPKKPIDKVTCAEFNGLDETFKPKVIAWAAGYQQGQKKPDVVTVDIEGVDKVAPIVIDECNKAPTASFWSKVEGELKKIF